MFRVDHSFLVSFRVQFIWFFSGCFSSCFVFSCILFISLGSFSHSGPIELSQISIHGIHLTATFLLKENRMGAHTQTVQTSFSVCFCAFSPVSLRACTVWSRSTPDTHFAPASVTWALSVPRFKFSSPHAVFAYDISSPTQPPHSSCLVKPMSSYR